jgi:hypothetical protein
MKQMKRYLCVTAMILASSAGAADLDIQTSMSPAKDGSGRFASLTVRNTRGSGVIFKIRGEFAENGSRVQADEMEVIIPGGDKLVMKASDKNLKSNIQLGQMGGWKFEGTFKVTEGSYKVILIDRRRNEYENTTNSASVTFVPNSKEEAPSKLLLY